MEAATPVPGPSRPAKPQIQPHQGPEYPAVSSQFDAAAAHASTSGQNGKRWMLSAPQEQSDQTGFAIIMTSADDDDSSRHALSQELFGAPHATPFLRFPQRVPLTPRQALRQRRATADIALKRRRQPGVADGAARSAQRPLLVSNALKLPSLGVSRTTPTIASAPVVTISSQCRPDPRVVYDQHHFKGHRGYVAAADTSHANGTSGLSTAQQRASLDVSLMSNIPILTPSNGGSNTLSSPASSVTGLPTTVTPASSFMADTNDGNLPSSPTVRRANAWVKPRSWADLVTHMGSASISTSQSFSENIIGASATPNRSPTQSVVGSPAPRGRVNGNDGLPRRARRERSAAINGSTAAAPRSLETIIREAETQFSAPLTYPRGIINTGNMCFANAILQALVYCAPFFNLFRTVGQHVPHDFHNSTPLMEAVIQFSQEFQLIPESVQEEMREAPVLAADSLRMLQASSEPFIPDLLYDAMKLHKRFDTMRRGHQEDAEEFLGFFLDTLHEELQTAVSKAEARSQKNSSGSRSSSLAPSVDAASSGDLQQDAEFDEREVNRPASPSEGDGWLEVGQKGKTSFTRTTSTAHSPITRIFGGKLRSVLRAPGSKDSVTLEPYQPLQLDIQPAHVTTVEEALENLTVPETISGVMSANKHLVEATKQVFIETLPPVLVLHLKRFVYDDVGGVQKSSKVIGYGPVLEISENVISPGRRGEVQRRYKLFAVVYHHGRYASGGHYTVDVLRQDRSEWLHIDDTTWSSVPPPSSSPDVAPTNRPGPHAHGGSAYLMFFAREDALEQPQQPQGMANGLANGKGVSTEQKKMPSLDGLGSATPVPSQAATSVAVSSVPGAGPHSPGVAMRRAHIPGAAPSTATTRTPRSRTTSAQVAGSQPAAAKHSAVVSGAGAVANGRRS